MAVLTNRKAQIFLFLIVLVSVSISLSKVYQWTTDSERRGKKLNQNGWERSFIERGFPIPASGPREGYWGSRLGKKIVHSDLGWREPEIHLPGLLEIDERGFQRYTSSTRSKSSLVIIGGSVAFGAHASEISKTYFNVIGTELERRAMPAEITIIAAGAWKSVQDLIALRLYGGMIKPELIIFLNGLNDLTNGATAETLFGTPVKPADGSEWTPLYHAHDYRERTANYLNNIDKAAKLSRELRSKLFVVLQPSLVEKTYRTSVENNLLEGALLPHSSAGALLDSYQTIRNGLNERVQISTIRFLDCSRVFNNERATTFSDIWHFSDFGHDILGKAMVNEIATILGSKKTKAYRARKTTSEPSSL